MPRLLLLPLALALLAPAAHAQLLAARASAPGPLDDSTRGFMPSAAFGADLQRGGGSAGTDMNWNIRIGGAVSLYRGDRWGLQLAATNEVAANVLNDGAFNPRGATWEEELRVGVLARGLEWRAAVFHRCRHDIDNSDAPDERETPPDYAPRKRMVLLTGAHAGVVTPWHARAGLRARAALRGEWYAWNADNRLPVDAPGTSWNDARGALVATARVERPLGRAALYARGMATAMRFASSTGGNQRAELGVRLPGRAGMVELYAAHERVFDDVSAPAPRASRVTAGGIRFASKTAW